MIDPPSFPQLDMRSVISTASPQSGADQSADPSPILDPYRKRFRGNEPAQFKATGKEGLGEGVQAKE